MGNFTALDSKLGLFCVLQYARLLVWNCHRLACTLLSL